MHNCISDALDIGKNFLKELRTLGLIPRASGALHVFMPEKRDEYFSNIAISSTENPVESLNSILTPPLEVFRLDEVSENDVILATLREIIGIIYSDPLWK